MRHLLRDNLVSFNDDTAAHDVMVYESDYKEKTVHWFYITWNGAF